MKVFMSLEQLYIRFYWRTLYAGVRKSLRAPLCETLQRSISFAVTTPDRIRGELELMA